MVSQVFRCICRRIYKGDGGKTTGVHVAGAGSIISVRPVDKSTSPIFQGGVVGDNTTIQNVLINANGSAEFAGNVSVGDPSKGGSTTGSKLQANGKIIATRSSAPDRVLRVIKLATHRRTL